jgi:hypothetical protein
MAQPLWILNCSCLSKRVSQHKAQNQKTFLDLPLLKRPSRHRDIDLDLLEPAHQPAVWQHRRKLVYYFDLCTGADF